MDLDALLDQRNEIVTLRAQQAALHEQEKGLLAQLQEACPHPTVVERPFRSSDFGSPFWERRMCITCAYEEEQNGCGYTRLGKPAAVIPVPFDAYWGYRDLVPIETSVVPATHKVTPARHG